MVFGGVAKVIFQPLTPKKVRACRKHVEFVDSFFTSAFNLQITRRNCNCPQQREHYIVFFCPRSLRLLTLGFFSVDFQYSDTAH